MPNSPLTPDRREELCRGIREWIAAGYALIPSKLDGSKSPAVSEWRSVARGEKPPMSVEDLIARVQRGQCDGVAAIMGLASGNAEMIEVEGRAMPRFIEIEQHAVALGLADLLARLQEGCAERTPSGGVHFYLRVADGPVAGNTKFALRPGASKPKVLAETRGQGGYSIVAPSGGRTHETGRAWEMIAGSPANTPVFTSAEVEDLHNLFRMIDEMPVAEPKPVRAPASRRENGTCCGEATPGDDFNRRAHWDDLLEDWTRVGEATDPDGQTRVFWRRPGKDVGTSATVLGDGKWLYVFSTSVPLPTEEPLSKFAVYTHLHHAGDFSAAAADLSRQGYGVSGQARRRSLAFGEIEYRMFPVDLLPQPLRQFVHEGAEATGCDPSLIALPALAALGAAIGNTRRLRLKLTWNVPPILWTAVVGESGVQKSTGYQLGIKPVQRRQQLALDRYNADRQRYEARMEQWEREKGRQRYNAAARPEKPTPPIAERVLVGDTTVEALAPLLKDNPRGVLLGRDELRGWLGSFDRYASGSKGKSDEAHWLSMYNGASILVDRKTSQAGPIFVPSAAVCITGGIQPGTLRRALGVEHRESGLAARLLMSYPPRRPKQWTEADVCPDVVRDYEDLFDRLYSLQATTDADGKSVPVTLTLDEDAKALFIAYANAHNRELVDLSGDLAAAWSKLEETAARLALVLELTRWARGAANAPPDCVGAESMGAAIGLVEWFKHETRRIYADVLSGDADEKPNARERLTSWLRGQGGVTTVREVQQGCRFLKEPGQAEAALEDLRENGYGDWLPIEGGQRGRPTRRFRLSG
jgi:hypothetical protein